LTLPLTVMARIDRATSTNMMFVATHR